MLQMNCPNCKGIIVSPFLAELDAVECKHCMENVPVIDVFVKTKSFTIHRDDLIKRIFRYRTLLREVENEKILMADDDTVSEATKKSLAQFSSTLQELLTGARKNFRLSIPFELPVVIDCQDKSCHGQLTNLSSEGASVSFSNIDHLPKQGAVVEFDLALPGMSEPLVLKGRVVWSQKQVTKGSAAGVSIGISFIGLEEKIRACLWDFILDSESPQISLTASSGMQPTV